MSNFDNSLRDSFRPKSATSFIIKLMRENPNKVYQFIRFDETYDPNGENVDKYLNKGWEIVVDDQPVVDGRASAPDNKQETNLRKHPLTKKGRGKAEFLAVCIDKDKLLENEKAKAQRNLERYIASSTGRQVVKKGSQLKITDSEVNESNMNNQSEV